MVEPDEFAESINESFDQAIEKAYALLDGEDLAMAVSYFELRRVEQLSLIGACSLVPRYRFLH